MRDRRFRRGEKISTQTASQATNTLRSFDTHPKQTSQFWISIVSTPSVPAVTENFDVTHVMSSSVKSRGVVSGTPSYSCSPLFVALPSLSAPYASASPTRPAWRPLSQSSICLVIRYKISLALRKPNVFVRTTWEKMRGLSEFQVLPSIPHHSAASMAMNRIPTAPEGLAYQLVGCAEIRFQQRFKIASSVTPPSRCDPLL